MSSHISDSYKDADALQRLYWDESMSTQEIGEKFGVHAVTILNWMKRHDIPRRKKGSRYRDRDRLPPNDELASEYEAGATLRELGAKYDVDPGTVSYRMDKAGVPRRPSGPCVCETVDGGLVKSSYERKVANWLYHNGYDYEYEPDVSGTRFIPDFMVCGRIIEVWGLMGRDDYRERHDEKRKAYQDLDLDVVDVYPEDMDGLPSKLEMELSG